MASGANRPGSETSGGGRACPVFRPLVHSAMQFAGRTKGIGFYYVSLLLLAVVLWLAHATERSKLGFYFRAIRDDQEGAEGIGVPSRLYKVLARCIMV